MIDELEYKLDEVEVRKSEEIDVGRLEDMIGEKLMRLMLEELEEVIM